ncbi:MAG: glycosyltransferase family 39 protein [Leptospirales bacterium]|jgi:4-amino-4-deoxy-L-arabinose transferase-like glycosyltransferase
MRPGIAFHWGMTTAPNSSPGSENRAPAAFPAQYSARFHSFDLIALGVLAASLLGRLILSLDIPLVADEAYYWEWSRRLDFSYYDQGPGVAFYIRAFTALLGDTHFALKVAAISAALISLLFFYATTFRLGFSPLRRLLALMIAVFLPGFFAGAILIMHDSPFMIAWAAALYFTIAYIRSGESVSTRRPLLLMLVFACVGLGELSKHTMAFFAMSFALWMFTDRRELSLLLKWYFWAGCALALALVSPILIWNAGHNWDGVTAILYLRSSLGSSGGLATAMNYLVGQLLTFSPLWLLVFLCLAASAAAQTLRAKYRTWRGKRKPNAASADERATTAITKTPPEIRFLWINALILPVFFLYLSASREIQGNWTFASYLACVLLLVRAMPESWSSAGRTARVAVATFAVGSIFTLALNLLAYYSIPIVRFAETKGYKIESYFVPGYRPIGFSEAIAEITAFRDREAPEAGIVASNRYQDAAVASWHSPGKPFITSMNVMQRNQYNYWPGLEKGRDYVVYYIHEKTCERSEVFIQPTLGFMFDEVEEFPERDVIVDGAVVKRYQVYIARNYRRSWEDMVYNYFVRRSIQDMMPNLRGYFSKADTKAGQADAMLALQRLRDARAGGDGCGFLVGL